MTSLGLFVTLNSLDVRRLILTRLWTTELVGILVSVENFYLHDIIIIFMVNFK